MLNTIVITRAEYIAAMEEFADNNRAKALNSTGADLSTAGARTQASTPKQEKQTAH